MKTSRLAAAFGPLTPGSIQRHATFLTRDLRAPSGGSEYRLEVGESADCLQTNSGFGDQISMKFLFCKDVRCVFHSLFQVCFNMFYKFLDVSETAIGNPTRDLSQLPLLPTKVMRCEGWIVAGKTCEGFGNVGNTRITRTFSVFIHVEVFIFFSGGRVSTFPS